MTQSPDWIVAEVTKNWSNGEDADGGETTLLAQRFELVINHNRRRGYKLHSFQLHQLHFSDDGMSGTRERVMETIIAVFRRG